MSEAKESKGKKKGGKLPIILVAVLVVAGGGFFAMGKGKGEEKPPEPELELGAVESLGDEFLVNIDKDGRTFLVCKVSVQLRALDKNKKDDHVSAADPAAGDGGHGGATDPTYSIARDAVIGVLTQKSIGDLTGKDSLKMLRREVAAALNHVLDHSEEEEPAPEEDSKSKKKKKKHDEEEESHGGGHEVEIDHEWLDELGWDSDTGPVLKVFFTDFAFQKY